MKKKACIFYGGWEGHEPELVSARSQKMLGNENLEVIRENTLEHLEDEEFLKTMDLIVPCWTQGELEDRCCFAITETVMSGVGLAGCHGGTCDSFHWSVEWQFMIGSQWVSHPGDPWMHHVSRLTNENLAYIHEHYPESKASGAFWTHYGVNFKRQSPSLLIQRLDDFNVYAEQYYLHLDPCVDVLASTKVHTEGPHSVNGVVDMPIIYTKLWGKERVFYNALGHHDGISDIPQVVEAQRRGLLWAAR